MKTDKEMTRDILNHLNNVKKEKVIMKRRIYKLTALSCAFALIFIAAFAFIISADVNSLPDNSDPTAAYSKNDRTHLNRNFFVMVANAAEDTETVLNKDVNVKIPLCGILMVKDTKGWSASDKDAVMLELKERLLRLYGKDKGWRLTGSQEEATVYFGTADYLKLMIEESDSVDSINIYCTENGRLSVSDKSVLSSPSKYVGTLKQGTSITLTGKEYKEIYGKEDGMRIDWFISEKMINTFNVAPETPLSSVSDVITVAINFADGTNETFSIKLDFDDEGMLAASFCQ